MRGIYDAAFDGVGTGLVYGAAAVKKANYESEIAICKEAIQKENKK